MTPSRQRTIRWCGVTLAVIAVVSAVWYFRHEQEIDSYLSEQARHFRYRTSKDPLLADLSSGRIKLGDPVEDFIAAHPPWEITRHGDYVTLVYRFELDVKGIPEGVYVLAKHGKLVYAKKYGRHPQDVFFGDESAYGFDFFTSRNAESHHYVQMRLEAQMAVTGACMWGYFYPSSQPGEPGMPGGPSSP